MKFTNPAKLLRRDNTPMTKKAKRSGVKTSFEKQVSEYKDLVKSFNNMVGKLPLTMSKKSMFKKGIKTLINPAIKNLGTIKPGKTKVIKDVRGIKKK